LAFHFQTCKNSSKIFQLCSKSILGEDSFLINYFLARHDIQVGLKKKYNDTYKSSKSLLGGSEWYCQQAYRALNQAAGAM